jgi:DNA invertase Pin-like site-specific DNA recombinase
MTDVCRILLEVSPAGIGMVFVDAVGPAERAKALRFLAAQMTAVDQFDRELKKPEQDLSKGEDV